MAQNGHKWAFCGHKQPWRLQNGGSRWIKDGSRLDTSGGVGRNHFPGPEWPSGRAIRPQNGHNGSFVAISRSGGSKMVDQRGSRLDQGRTHPGGCFGPIFWVHMAIGGAPYGLKMAQISHKWAFCVHKQVWRLQNSGSAWIKVGSR